MPTLTKSHIVVLVLPLPFANPVTRVPTPKSKNLPSPLRSHIQDPSALRPCPRPRSHPPPNRPHSKGRRHRLTVTPKCNQCALHSSSVMSSKPQLSYSQILQASNNFSHNICFCLRNLLTRSILPRLHAAQISNSRHAFNPSHPISHPLPITPSNSFRAQTPHYQILRPSAVYRSTGKSSIDQYLFP